MLERILHIFSEPESEPLPETDAKLALGALLVRVAKSDQDYQASEISRIDRILASLNSINPIEAAKMRATCEKIDLEAPDTDTFAEIIHETVSVEARLEALRAMWEVVLADGVRRSEEENIVNMARNALGLSEADSQTARAQVEAG